MYYYATINACSHSSFDIYMHIVYSIMVLTHTEEASYTRNVWFLKPCFNQETLLSSITCHMSQINIIYHYLSFSNPPCFLWCTALPSPLTCTPLCTSKGELKGTRTHKKNKTFAQVKLRSNLINTFLSGDTVWPVELFVI